MQPPGRLIHPLHVVNRHPPLSAAATDADTGARNDQWRNVIVGLMCQVLVVFAFRRSVRLLYGYIDCMMHWEIASTMMCDGMGIGHQR